MGPNGYSRLLDFIGRDMRMSHVYQPVMLRVLLENEGRASRSAIAKAFLAQDRSQIEYYESIVRNMPGRVLGRHGIVERVGEDYRLTDDFASLTADQRQRLIEACDDRLATYLEKRGLAPWQHRKKSAGYVPGSLRYDVIRRAKGRCEACGASVEDRALEVDHILPRNKGGSDDPSNLQALCYVCNAQKRDRDQTDYAAVRGSYGVRQEGCVFCEMTTKRIVVTHELAYAARDLYPVTDGHILVLPKRHVADYFDLHQPERNAIEELLHKCRKTLKASDASINGFNIGANAGQSAGQTVLHVHVHLIPRRVGDVDNPRGGVRGVIPERQDYVVG
jgi:diadenosine tetraphosphate (Ap4A) HIT family hydrolase